MTEWVYFVVPLVVLPIILLFRFVGCGLDTKGEVEEIIAGEGAFPYEDTIMEEKPNVIAYWRLVDAPTATVAIDKKDFQNGVYVTVPGLDPEPPGTLAGSEAADGDFSPHQSLVVNESTSTKCRKFNGGHVVVPFKPGLYTNEFTIEAWIKPEWAQHEKYEHTLLDAHGHYQKLLETSPSWHGFRIFANRENRWQVYLAPVGVVELKAAPEIKPGAATMHLAVTVKSDPAIPAKKHVIIFVDGKIIGLGTANVYSPPDGAPLFIGVSNTESNPSFDPKPRHPVLSPIQEVVLYNKALSPEVIKKHHDAGKGVA